LYAEKPFGEHTKFLIIIIIKKYILTDEQVEERPHIEINYPVNKIDVFQMWDTRFSGLIPDFKLLVSRWILLKNSNLNP
jgi:hypothetical protein